MNPRKLAWIGGGAATLTAGLLGWAFLWPEGACAQPACARQRFAVAVELDAFRNVPPISFELPNGRGNVSVRSILAAGGVDVAVTEDQLDLPYKAASGPLDRADLYQFAAAWRSRNAPPGADAKVYALLTTALVSDNGEPLFGIMFDVAGREAFAVAPATTVHRFGTREPEAVPMLQLRTFVHELLHTLNRRHLDASQMGDGRLTLEAPTRCIAGQQQGQWYLREPPLMAISPQTIRFFQTAASDDVLPGKGGSPFEQRRASATECDDARANRAGNAALTRWQLAMQRLQRLVVFPTAEAAENGIEEEAAGTDESETEPRQAPPIELRVQAQPAPYPLGYPIAVRVMARNTGLEPLPIEGRLDPGYGMLHIEYRPAGSEDWRALQPLAWFEPIGDEESLLAPAEHTEQTVPIYFGDAGWTFAEAGEYEVRARLETGDEAHDALSEPVALSIAEPGTPDDRLALAPLLEESGALSQQVGRLLTFGGRIGSQADIAPLEAAAEQYGHTALGGALRLTLVSQRLRPPIDPLTGERAAPDFSDARELLQDTCTDSGIAALKFELLQRHAGGIPRSMRNRAETGSTAWDGTTSMRGGTMPTYSDSALRLHGPSLHFCFDESQLRAPVRRAAARVARTLRRADAARVVVVGHGDFEGSCRYNDKLALRRARAVRRALIDGGVPADVVHAASLGERRPLDFTATPAARDLNRRVEILMEGEVGDEPDAERILPSCPAREPPGTDAPQLPDPLSGFLPGSEPAAAPRAARKSRDSLTASSMPL